MAWVVPSSLHNGGVRVAWVVPSSLHNGGYSSNQYYGGGFVNLALWIS